VEPRVFRLLLKRAYLGRVRLESYAATFLVFYGSYSDIILFRKGTSPFPTFIIFVGMARACPVLWGGHPFCSRRDDLYGRPFYLEGDPAKKLTGQASPFPTFCQNVRVGLWTARMAPLEVAQGPWKL